MPSTGSFAAASNVTGALEDTVSITRILHRAGALSFWDYATAAPYVEVDMNPNGTSTSDKVRHDFHVLEASQANAPISRPDKCFVLRTSSFACIRPFVDSLHCGSAVLLRKHSLLALAVSCVFLRQALVSKDAIFISGHKFLGGAGTPGLLVCKKRLFSSNKVPVVPGGGTVLFVSRLGHGYLRYDTVSTTFCRL